MTFLLINHIISLIEFKQLHEKELEIVSNAERVKTDYDRRLKTIQKDIDRTDEFKSRIVELEIQVKSKIF